MNTQKLWLIVLVLISAALAPSAFADKILFYDATTGQGEFYAVSASGDMGLMKQHSGWRPVWHSIVPGNYNNDGITDLLFYDPTTGQGEFYAVSASGDMGLMKQHGGWRKAWKQLCALR